MMKNVYTVGQINAYIRNMFAQDFMLKRVSVSGEVSNCKYHSSGHVYFSLKDETGVISAVLFANMRKTGLKFPMKNGDKIVADGAVRVYERQGSYQLYVNHIELDGAGQLYQRFEELKRKLKEMGMFDQAYKKPVPKFPDCIGVVTAPTGAAVRDIQNIIHRRNPFVQLILFPAQVQGEGAAESVIKGICMLEAVGVDLIIVGRGGGSIEDLWAFNEESVARAIFDCSVPVISAVGHETDVTISDFVADLRAPTPSAAAELAVCDARETANRLKQTRMHLNRVMRENVLRSRARLQQDTLRLQAAGPMHRLDAERQRLDEYADRMQNILQESLNRSRHRIEEFEKRLPLSISRNLVSGRHRLEMYASRLPVLIERRYTEGVHRLELLSSALDALSPLKRLGSGYVYLRDEQGRAITEISCLKPGKKIYGELADGSFTARTEEIVKRKKGSE